MTVCSDAKCPVETRKPEKSYLSTDSTDGSILEPQGVHLKALLAVFAVCLVYFAQMLNVVGAGALGQSIAAVVGGRSKVVWLTSVITILTTVLSPPVSQAADYWGRKPLLVTLTACGAIGSIIVARATSMEMAIGGQIVAGLSFGAQPLLHAVASEVLPRRYRPLAQAADNFAASCGAITSLLVGGAMTRHRPEGFRNYWYLVMAVYVLATTSCIILYSPPRRPAQAGTNFEKLKGLDWVGYMFLLIGLVLFSMGLSWSKNPYQWTDAHVLAPILIGITAVFTLVWYEWKVKCDGMFNHRLFANGYGWNFPIAILCVFGEGIAFFAANNYFAFEVSVLFEKDPVRTGLRYSVAFMAYAISAILGGLFCSRTKVIKWPAVGGFMCIVIFFICMATATPGSSAAVWVYPVFFGAGMGVLLCALVSVAQLWGTVGIAVFGAVFTSKLSADIGPKITEKVLPLGLKSTYLPELIEAFVNNNQTAMASIPGMSPAIIAAGTSGLFEAYSTGFRYVWITAGCFAVAAAIVATLLFDPAKEFTMHIDAPAEVLSRLDRNLDAC